MIRIFGYNILTDSELKKIEQDNWDRFKKYLKIKELWYVKTRYIKKPKCSACDENRCIKITLPDGSLKTISCSCDGHTKTRSPEIFKGREIIIIKDEGVFMTNGLSDYDFEDKIIFNKKELIDSKRLPSCVFTSKKLCEQAIKIIEGKNND